MRRFPHTATLLRPTQITDGYGDAKDGPLAPVGEPFSAWLQMQLRTSTGENLRAEGEPVVTTPRLYVRLPLPADIAAIEEDDVIEVNGKRYRVEGEPYSPTNPRGRSRLLQLGLTRVTRGG